MTQNEKLEALVRKAIDGGWKLPISQDPISYMYKVVFGEKGTS